MYYHPEPISESELALMRRIDELHLEHPFAGSRMLRLRGIDVGRRHVGTLMRRMGIQALYRKPSTSNKHPSHPVFPYLLRESLIERANQAWALDITYIPMTRGWGVPGGGAGLATLHFGGAVRAPIREPDRSPGAPHSRRVSTANIHPGSAANAPRSFDDWSVEFRCAACPVIRPAQ